MLGGQPEAATKASQDKSLPLAIQTSKHILGNT